MKVATNRNGRRVVALAASLGAAALIVAGCSNGEESTSNPGTQPSVVTGNPAPNGAYSAADANGDQSPAGQDSGSAAGDALVSGSATATLKDTAGNQVGTATFKENNGQVTVAVTVDNKSLSAGTHAEHIHQVGQCVGDFTSAGGHFQAPGHTGTPSGEALDTITVDAAGNGQSVTTTDAFTVAEITGKSIVIHAGDGTPGASESRVACGVIGS